MTRSKRTESERDKKQLQQSPCVDVVQPQALDATCLCWTADELTRIPDFNNGGRQEPLCSVEQPTARPRGLIRTVAYIFSGPMHYQARLEVPKDRSSGEQSYSGSCDGPGGRAYHPRVRRTADITEAGIRACQRVIIDECVRRGLYDPANP